MPLVIKRDIAVPLVITLCILRGRRDFLVASSYGDTAKREELASELEKILGLGSIKDPIPSNPSCFAENQPVCLSLAYRDISCRCAPRPDEYETR
jgi:hypothetical protein